MYTLEVYDMGNWATSREAALLLGTTRGYLNRLVARGKLEPKLFEGRRMFRVADLLAYRGRHPYLGSAFARVSQTA